MADPLSAIFSFLKMIPKLINIVTEIVMGIKDIFLGLAREFQEFPQGAFYLGVHLAIFIQYLGVFVFTNLFCAMQMIQNFTSCFFWYALDIFGKILYLVPQVFILIFSLFGIPAREMEKNIWDALESVDRLVVDMSGYHLIHFPKSVRDRCYNCKRLSTSALIGRAADTFGDINDPIIPLMTGGLLDMFNGARRAVNALLSPIGFSV
jgi:hypothetical protein